MKTNKFIWLKFILLIYLPFFYFALFLPLFIDREIHLLASILMSLFGLVITPALFGLVPFAFFFSIIDVMGILKNSYQRVIFGSFLGTSMFVLFFFIAAHDKFMTKGVNTDFLSQCLLIFVAHGSAVWSIFILPKLIKKLISTLK